MLHKRAGVASNVLIQLTRLFHASFIFFVFDLLIILSYHTMMLFIVFLFLLLRRLLITCSI